MKENYTPGTMSFSDGFWGLGREGDVGYTMAVDEEKARAIITEILSVREDVDYAELGLDGDWDVNSTRIYSRGRYYDYDSYHNSIWATPMLIVYYKDGTNQAFECWKKEKDDNEQM